MSRFFIKKLQRQEMGSPTMENGQIKFHRGRYLLISKEYINFFPHLSTTVLNDCTALPILVNNDDEIVYAQYVYHNSKYIDTVVVNGQPRDEYRIYLNDRLDHSKELFRPDDIVVMKKIEQEDFGFYALHIFPPASKYYAFWNEKFSANSSYAMCELAQAPTFDSNIILPEKTAPILDDARVTNAIENQQNLLLGSDTMDAMGANLFNSRSFRDFVMNAYGYKCAVTQRVIACNGFDNLEAAHIMPQAHNGSFLPCNGIAMSRDLHFAFDKGFFTIQDDYKITIHPDVLRTNSYINEYNGQSIFIPKVDFFRPRKEFLAYHREHIYGTFRQIRSINIA